ncbi:MAG TPA: ABATE domain-containing protein [Solirubrobacteraceae bacterium]|nr:ABATE domain-containing protein [Solirubrobacteraceae bacterium]
MQSIAEIPFIAGNTALDFVNTAEMRGHPAAGDALMTTADLRLWGRRYGLITRSTPDAGDEGELERAREARELLYGLFVARAHGRVLPKRLLARLAELGADAYRAATLEVTADGTLRWRWNRSRLSTVRHVAVTSAIDLLHADPAPRLKQCPGDHCGWLFLDLTKRGNRRWCSMGECGQEAKNLKRRKPAGAHPTTSS